MRTLLICHEGVDLHREGIARWLASFSKLAGVVVLREGPRASLRRARRELRRAGVLGFADALAFRVYYRLFVASGDAPWEKKALCDLCQTYPAAPSDTPVLRARSPNSSEVAKFITERSPDIVLALCKVLLRRSVYSIPSRGTFVFHPGVCPEYRNAHGCFWALANGDVDRVAMTLLKIDDGIDTGPIYGHFSYAFDELSESHIVIQHRVVLENLGALQRKLSEIYAGHATPIDTTDRASATWGQPRLTSYIKWKYRARRRNGDESTRTALS